MVPPMSVLMAFMVVCVELLGLHLVRIQVDTVYRSLLEISEIPRVHLEARFSVIAAVPISLLPLFPVIVYVVLFAFMGLLKEVNASTRSSTST